MKTFSTKAAIKRGWHVFKANKKLLVASTFILMVLGALQDVIRKSVHGYGLSAVILIIAFYVVGIILKIGYTKMYLKLEDGEPTGLKDLWAYSKLFLKYLLASLAYFGTVIVGLILLIIPGLYFAIRYIFVPIIIVDEYVSIEQAFHMSAEMTRGVKWKLIGFLVVMLLLNILGAVAIFIGLFITIPVTMLAMIHVYRKLEKPAPTQTA